MQALRHIHGIGWYGKVTNTVVNDRTKLPDLYCLLLLTDVIRYSVTSVAYRRTHCNCQ